MPWRCHPINLEAETGKHYRIDEMDVRHSVELFQGGMCCLQLATRKLIRATVLDVCAQCPSIAAVATLSNPYFGSPVVAMLHPGENNARLFHDQIILYGCDPFDATCDFTRFIDGLLRANEAAQLNGALKGFDTDLE
jgi:hypothetical protein